MVEGEPALRAVPVFSEPKVAPPKLRDQAIRYFQEQRRKEQERVARFGEVRPQISTLWKGHRFIAVRNKLYYSDKWKFFADFLRDHVPHIFEKEWFDAEIAKPECDRHPVMQWRIAGIRYMNGQQPSRSSSSSTSKIFILPHVQTQGQNHSSPYFIGRHQSPSTSIRRIWPSTYATFTGSPDLMGPP